MRGPARIAQGALTDSQKPVSFRFDGRLMRGLAGDTLASALLANGQRIVGRSLKYHRPRGIVTAGPEEPCALVTVVNQGGREPNRPATTLELREGLVARSQNCWPSLRFDALAINITCWRDFCRGGLLLQDLHGARAGLGNDLRAAVAPRRRPRPPRARARTRRSRRRKPCTITSTCWSWAPAAPDRPRPNN